MATTLLRKQESNLMLKTIVETLEGVDTIVVHAVIVDNELKPLDKPSYYSIDYSEEEFHTDLRKEAAQKKQLITSHSTDPEWNPEGYTKNLEDELSEEQEGNQTPE